MADATGGGPRRQRSISVLGRLGLTISRKRWGCRPRADEGWRVGRSAAPPAGRMCHARLAEQ